MKKVLFKNLSVLMVFVILAAQCYSLSARPLSVGIPSVDEEVFYLDQSTLDLAFAELNELDAYLDENRGITYSAMEAAGSALIANISDVTAPFGQTDEGGEPPLGIPAFWWGCVLGWVGLLLVYLLTDNDKAQTKKALNGCLVGTGVSIALSVVYYVIIYSQIDDLY
jgi:hypothetical protein